MKKATALPAQGVIFAPSGPINTRGTALRDDTAMSRGMGEKPLKACSCFLICSFWSRAVTENAAAAVTAEMRRRGNWRKLSGDAGGWGTSKNFVR